MEHTVLKRGIKSNNDQLYTEKQRKRDVRNMDSKILATGVAISLVAILVLTIANSTELFPTLTNINPIGALAAACAAVIGIVWLIRTSK